MLVMVDPIHLWRSTRLKPIAPIRFLENKKAALRHGLRAGLGQSSSHMRRGGHHSAPDEEEALVHADRLRFQMCRVSKASLRVFFGEVDPVRHQ